MEKEERRLAAVMLTDMVGYTALTQQDERKALRLLEKQNELLEAVFRKHSGRVIKTIGDAFLVEFTSALEAFQCAVDAQKALSRYNSHRTDDVIRIRIGVHLGDVVERRGDVFGDAVNIASRIEPLADPGGVCVSQQVFDQVANKVDQPMEKIEPHRLKNVDADIGVYRVLVHETVGRQTPDVEGGLDTHRVAVLPFTSISPDPNDEYFADGLTDELITKLSFVNSLRVVSRTSVMRYKGLSKTSTEVGYELRVGSIIEGSVRKYGEKVRVTVELVDTKTDEHIWSSVYDRELSDLLAIQSEIAENVANALKVETLAAEVVQIRKIDTENVEAYSCYLRGRQLMASRTDESLREAGKLFEQATKLDSEFARAYIGIADAFHLLVDYGYLPTEAGHLKALKAITKALELNNKLAEAHTTMGALLQHYDHQYAEAVEEYKNAIGLNPSYAQAHLWYAICLLALGRQQEALDEILVAKELDPLSPIVSTIEGRIYSHLGEEGKAQELWEAVVKTNPDFPVVYFWRGEYWLSKSRTSDALADIRKGIEIAGRRPPMLSLLGFALAKSGDREGALQVIDELTEMSGRGFTVNFAIGKIFAGLGDKDKTFECLERAIDEHSIDVGFLRFSPTLSVIRPDPRYADLLSKMHLRISPAA
ncbi:MAG: adenylate/guanylate cyclase domain-containing protein [Thaumarchaeota archaeon]|nr:adenylate/guanylate cyclase domain-containing protein [Nitrososphaerota archaeon]